MPDITKSIQYFVENDKENKRVTITPVSGKSIHLDGLDAVKAFTEIINRCSREW